MIETSCIPCEISLLCVADAAVYIFQCTACKKFFVQLNNAEQQVEIFRHTAACYLPRVHTDIYTCSGCALVWR